MHVVVGGRGGVFAARSNLNNFISRAAMPSRIPDLNEDLKLGSPIWGFPKIRCTILGVPIIRTIVYWGTLILGNYHINL